MPRPKRLDRGKVLSAYVPEEIYNMVVKLSKKWNKSISEVVTELLKEIFELKGEELLEKYTPHVDGGDTIDFRMCKKAMVLPSGKVVCIEFNGGTGDSGEVKVPICKRKIYDMLGRPICLEWSYE